MCYKETPYHGKCGCYGRPQFVGEPCIRVAVDASLRSTGCWDVLDLGVKSTNTMCRRCEVAEKVLESSDGQSSTSSWSGSASSSAMINNSSSASSLSGTSSEGSGKSSSSSRAQACVSLSGMATYKARTADGGIDRSTTAFQAFHETDGKFWTCESHKAPYVDSMYSRAPGKGRIAGLSASSE